MFRYFIKLLATSLAVFMVPHFISGVYVDSFGAALAVAFALGILNLLLRPLLILITLPLTLVTFGFFLLILNAVLFQIAGSFVSGFHIENFGAAFFASLLVSLVSWVLQIGVKKDNGKVVWHVSKSNSGYGRVRDLN